MTRRLEMMSLATLTGASRNPKRHANEAISTSIGRFGYVEPIVLDERTGRLVAGHGRMQALRASKVAGQSPPQGVEVREGEWLVPVLRGWASRSDTEAQAYLVASNNLTTKGGWDNGELGALLKELAAQQALDGTGFAEADIEAVLRDAALEQDKATGGDLDDVPPVEEVTGIMPGDVFELGTHRLVCGDSTRTADVDAVVDGADVQCVWTDPPYGVEYEGAAGSIQNDDAAGLPKLLAGAFAQCFRVLSPGGAIYIAHPAVALCNEFFRAFLDAGFRWKQHLTWRKDAFVLGHSDYHYQHEPIIYGLKPGDGRWGRGAKGWYGDDAQASVFDVPKPKRSEEHPTMKPVELVEAMVRNSAPPGGTVFEPFSGSGTTLMACERSGRKCCAVEIDPRFVQVAIDRWEAFTGLNAEKV